MYSSRSGLLGDPLHRKTQWMIRSCLGSLLIISCLHRGGFFKSDSRANIASTLTVSAEEYPGITPAHVQTNMCQVDQFKYSKQNNMITPGVLQYRYLRFFENKSRIPPLEEVFFVLEVLKEQPDLKERCPGAFVVTHLLAATVYFFRGLENNFLSKYHFDEAQRLLKNAKDSSLNIHKSWPVNAAISFYWEEREKLFPSVSGANETNLVETNMRLPSGKTKTILVPKNAVETRDPDFFDPSNGNPWAELDPDKVTTMDMVICHCREDLDWLKGGNFTAKGNAKVEITLLIYDKCSSPIGPEKTAEYMSTGLFKEIKSIPCDDPPGFRKDECVAYLKYLVDNYGNFPDLAMFLQSDAEEHMYWGYMNLVMHTITTGTSKQIPFIPLNNGRIVQNLTPCKSKIFEEAFGRVPEAIGTYCCAQFVVARRRLMLPEKKVYEKLLRMLDDEEAPKPACNDIKGHSTHCLMYEVIWHVMWGEKDVLPLRGENPELPLFLRARDVDNESHLPAGSQYMTTIMSLEMPEQEAQEKADKEREQKEVFRGFDL